VVRAALYQRFSLVIKAESILKSPHAFLNDAGPDQENSPQIRIHVPKSMQGFCQVYASLIKPAFAPITKREVTTAFGHRHVVTSLIEHFHALSY
jgi:hypothetical protein